MPTLLVGDQIRPVGRVELNLEEVAFTSTSIAGSSTSVQLRSLFNPAPGPISSTQRLNWNFPPNFLYTKTIFGPIFSAERQILGSTKKHFGVQLKRKRKRNSEPPLPLTSSSSIELNRGLQFHSDLTPSLSMRPLWSNFSRVQFPV